MSNNLNAISPSAQRISVRLFALIIGINKYISESIRNLQGCVNDAKAIKTFLSEYLHVPDSHLRFLANETATRSDIISNFKSHLTHNVKIKKGDAIVIFFAGHGSRVSAPEGWFSADGLIETFCPHDEGTNSQGKYIYGIPDRTINGLLRELAAVKGNNITVIFDSCHCGGMARQPSKVSHTARSVNTTRPIPASLDEDIWKSAFGRAACEDIPAGFQYKFMESHVFLAACQQNQSAYEFIPDEGYACGFFTNALVKQLRHVAVDQVTYSDLFSLLPEFINQKPHCEGTNKNQILFHGKVNGYPKSFQLFTNAEGKLQVKAGRIHGIARSTEFTVVNQNAGSKDQTILVAKDVYATASVLVPRPGEKRFALPDGGKVIISNWKDNACTLKVFISPSSWDQLAASLFPTQHTAPLSEATQYRKRNFIQVHSHYEAGAMIRLDSRGQLVIKSFDPVISKYANQTTRLTLQNRLELLPDILEAVAHFNFHLGRHNGSNPLGSKVKMELYRLTGPRGYRAPDTRIGNLLVDGHATVVEEEGAKYGVAIVNYSKIDLYPYLFFFDPFKYTIDSWYEPTAPLCGWSGLHPSRATAGYGASGGFAYEFTLPDEQLLDTGFLKLFVTSSKVNLDWITQAAPLDPLFSPRGGRREIDTETWDSWVADVTVKAQHWQSGSLRS